LGDEGAGVNEPRKILQITSYPPPRSGWGIRVQFLKRRLEADGHTCVVLNIGSSRKLPSTEYETVLGAWDYVSKLWRYSSSGFTAHVHVNGASIKGLVVALVAELINLRSGKRCFLTFHAGVEQKFFPRQNAPWLLPVFWLTFAIPSRIICNSESVKAKIQEYGIHRDKISAIPAFSRQYLEFEPEPLPDALERFYARFPCVLFCYVNLRPLFYPVELVEGFARLVETRRDAALVLCGISGYPEPDIQEAMSARIAQRRLDDRICLIGDLDHDEFLTALSRSCVYLRSHVSDGVCSSVLEAMALGVPVVASENGHRPAGVLTYHASDPDDLARVLDEALSKRGVIVSSLPRLQIPDTLSTEVQVLVGG
jgi:glycosyltransferase involved in cell wall biosynthesis